jgi:hypothetical protein
MANKISVVIEASVDAANRGVKSFRQSITDADGAAGKLKAGFGSAMDSVKANAGNLAVAGGAALVAFGVKAVGAFQDTALEAGRLAESLGLTSEQASRFMEVAGDLGIDMGTVEKAIGKMNVEVSKSPAYFDEIGAAIAKNADGTTDVQQTFLNVVDAINRMPDATDRAAASQKLLGRGWKDMSELVGQGSTKLKASLDAVSDAKVIDEQEVEKARRFREAMDNLRDASEDVLLVVGEELIPVLTDMANAIGVVKDAADALPDVPSWADGLVDSAERVLNPVKAVQGIFGDISETFGGTEDATDSMADAFEARMYTMQGASRDLSKQLGNTADGYTEFARGMIRESQRLADELTADWDRITGKITDEQAWLEVNAQIEALGPAWAQAVQEGEAGYTEFRQAQLDAQLAVAEYVREVGNIPPEKVTQINALIDQGKFAEAQALLNGLTTPLSVRVKPYLDMSALAGTQFRGVGTSGYTTGPGRAGGGSVSPRTMYPVGEGGRPELYEQNGVQYLIPGDRGQVTPARGGVGGSGMAVYLTVNAGLGTNGAQVGRQIVDVLEAHYRNGGRPPRSG